MAEIIPVESGEQIDSSTFPNNNVKNLSASWSVMYPGEGDENKSDESPEKQLKFLYKGYSQTLIMPVLGVSLGKVSLSNERLDFGNLWSLVGETVDKVTFYFRSTATSKFFPQVIIGTPEASLTRYLKNVKKIQL